MKRRPPFDPDGYYQARQILKPEGPVNVSPSTWWRLTKEGRLPKPLRLGTGLVVWRSADLNEASSALAARLKVKVPPRST